MELEDGPHGDGGLLCVPPFAPTHVIFGFSGVSMSEDRGTLGRQRVLTCQGLMLVVASETELVTKRPAPLRPVSKPLGPPHPPRQCWSSCSRAYGDPRP